MHFTQNEKRSNHLVFGFVRQYQVKHDLVYLSPEIILIIFNLYFPPYCRRMNKTLTNKSEDDLYDKGIIETLYDIWKNPNGLRPVKANPIAKALNAFRSNQRYRADECSPSIKWYEKVLQIYAQNLSFTSNQTENAKFRQWMLNSVVEPLMTALMQQNHTIDDVEHISNCCRYLVAIAVPLIKEDHPFSSAVIHHCLNTECPFFRTFGLKWVCHRNKIIKSIHRICDRLIQHICD